MIEVCDLVRRFSGFEAVNRVSFSVKPGEVVGFLGPNGAGKTTTLRMITGFLPPTSGRVTVDGLDAETDGRALRRRIGYLPENNPLYEELRVREYLEFRARLKGIPRARQGARIGEVLETVDAVEVRDRIIGACSKGFRQRVGLADALLAEPPVLILDEPTVGLDPGQIVQTRNLIKALSQEHTVILSTHILPEVEAICSRALILHHGRLLFDGAVEELGRGLGRGQLVCTLMADPGPAQACLRSVSGVTAVEPLEGSDGHAHFAVAAEEGRDVREAIFRACAAADIPLLEMAPRHVSLEEAFLSITTAEGLEEVPA